MKIYKQRLLNQHKYNFISIVITLIFLIINHQLNGTKLISIILTIMNLIYLISNTIYEIKDKFIITKVGRFITNKLEILVNWMLQQDDSYIRNKGEAYQMLSTVQFENYDANMCESPYYCLLVLKLMALFASKNAKFIVIHAWVN